MLLANPRRGNVAVKDGVRLIRGEVAVKPALGDVVERLRVGNLTAPLADLGTKSHFVHVLGDKIVNDHPALAAQVKQNSPVAVTISRRSKLFRIDLLSTASLRDSRSRS